MTTSATRTARRLARFSSIAALGALSLLFTPTALAESADAATTGVALVASAAAQAQPGDAKRTENLELRVYDTSGLPSNLLQQLVESFTTDAVQCRAFGIDLVSVMATNEQHETIRNTLNQVRALMGNNVHVDIALRRVNDASGVRVGEAAPESVLRIAPHRQIARSAGTRSVLRMHSTEMIKYVGQLTPVVAQQSTAFQPEIHSLTMGMSVEVIVYPTLNGVTTVHIRGMISEGALHDGPEIRAFVTQSNPEHGVAIQHATSATRSIDSEVAVRSDAPVVFAIVDDPAERGARLVATVRIARAE